jgi:hypothetical protein
MEKQTAVEWLVSQILVEYSTFFNEEGDLVDKPINQFFNAYQDSVDLIKYVNQAKEMEKQQIIDAVKYGYNGHKIGHYTSNFREQQELFEQYYKKTYGE